MAAEVASAYVTLLPSARGFGRNLDRQVGAEVGASGRKQGGIFGKLFGVAAAVGIGAIIKGSIGLEAEFSKTMNTMGAVADVPAAQLDKLGDLAMKMGADTVFSANDAANAMLELAKGGLQPAVIQAGALQAALTLAAAGGVDMETAATVMGNALNSFGLKGKDAGSVAAALAGGANASSASIASMAEALGQASTVAADAGLSVQETTAAIAAFSNAGIKGSDAGTSLKTFLSRLVPQTEATQKGFTALSLGFTNADGSFKNLAQISDELKDKFGDMSQAERAVALNSLFGSDARRAATVLMNEGGKGIKKYIKATSDQNAAQRTADAAMKGTAGAIESLKGSLETAQLQFGKLIAPAVQAGLHLATTAINNMTVGIKNLKGPLQAVGGFLAPLGPMFKAVFGWVVDNWQVVATFVGVILAVAVAIRLWAAAQAILNVVMAINPVTLVIIAVAALAAGLVYAYMHFQGFHDAVNRTFVAIKATLLPILQSLVATFKADVLPVIMQVIDAIKTNFVPTVKMLADKFTTDVLPVILMVVDSIRKNFIPVLQGAANTFKTVILPAIISFVGYLADNLWPIIQQIATLVITKFLPVFKQVATIIGTQVIPIIASLAKFLYTKVYPAIAKIVIAIGKNLKPIFDQLFKSIKTQLLPTIGKMADAFQKKILPAINALLGKFQEWLPTIEKVVLFVLNLAGSLLKIAAAILGKVLPPIIAFVFWLIGKLVPVIITVIGWAIKIVGFIFEVGAAFVGIIVNIVQFQAAVLSGVGKVIGFIKDLPGRAWLAIKGLAAKLALGAAIAFMKMHEKVTTGITTVINFIKGLPGRAWTALRGLASKLGQAAMAAMVWMGTKVNDGIATVVGFITGLPEKIGALKDKFIDVGKDLINGFIDGLKKAAGFIGGIAGSIWDSIKGLLNTAIDKLNGFLEIKIDLPLGKSININPPDIPQLAKGGIVRKPTLALIGEAGPEAVVPLSGNGAGMGNHFSGDININADTYDEMLRKMQRKVQQASLGGMPTAMAGAS